MTTKGGSFRAVWVSIHWVTLLLVSCAVDSRKLVATDTGRGGTTASGGSSANGGSNDTGGKITTGGTPATGGRATGGTGAQSTGGAWCGAGGAPPFVCTHVAPSGLSFVIDDFEDGNSQAPAIEGRSAVSWFAAGDNSLDGSVPSLTVESVTGGPSARAAHLRGGAYTSWGSLMGLNFATNSSYQTCPYDLTTYTALELWVRATGVSSIQVGLSTQETEIAQYGGTCTSDCGDHFRTAVPVTGTWTKHVVQFANLKRSAGGCSLNPSHVLTLQISAPPGQPYDLWLDDLRMLRLDGPYFTSGSWHGYVWSVTDSLGSVISADYTQHYAGDPYCATGTVVADSQYRGFAQVGFNLDQPLAGGSALTITPTKAGIRATVSNKAGSPLRLQLNGPNAATDPTDYWCVNVTGSGFFPFSQFNTTCWNNQGSYYTGQPISSVLVGVPGSNLTSTPFDFCASFAEADN